MYIHDKGLKYDNESVLNKLLNLNSFKAATKGRASDYITLLAERITQDVVMIADCIRMEGATKTTRVFLTMAKETKTSTAFHLCYCCPNLGVNRLYIQEELLILYGAKKVKQGRFYDICFYTSVVGMSHSLAATDIFFNLVRDLTGVYCQRPTIL